MQHTNLSFKLVILLAILALTNLAPVDPDLESTIYGFVKNAPAECDCEEELEDIQYVRLAQSYVELVGGQTVDVRADFVAGGETDVADAWAVSRPDPEITEVPDYAPQEFSSFTNIRLTAKPTLIPLSKWNEGRAEVTTSSTVRAGSPLGAVQPAILKIVGVGTRIVETTVDGEPVQTIAPLDWYAGDPEPTIRVDAVGWEGSCYVRLMKSADLPAGGEWELLLEFPDTIPKSVEYGVVRHPNGVFEIMTVGEWDMPLELGIFSFLVIAVNKEGQVIKQTGRIISDLLLD